MGRRNPILGMHPDLFIGESPIEKPWEEYDLDDLKKLTRKDFTDAEWEELPEEVVDEIYEHDQALFGPVENFAGKLYDHYISVAEPSVDDAVEMHGDVFDSRLSNATPSDFDSDDIQAIYDRFDAYDDDDVYDALVEALQYSENYDFELESQSLMGHQGAFDYYPMTNESIYIDKEALQDMLADSGITEDGQIERALDQLDSASGGVLTIKLSDIEDALQRQYGALEIYFDTGQALVMYPDFEKIGDYVAEQLGEEPIAESVEEREPGERVLLTLQDGFELVELLPSELKAQSRALGICVGDKRYGYGKAIKAGRTKILSLQTQAGKPKFTFEIALGPDGQPEACIQVKGKANRIPGFPNMEGAGKFKPYEVDLVIQCLRYLGLDPTEVDDLEPALRELPADDERRWPAEWPRSNPLSTRKTFCDPATWLW